MHKYFLLLVAVSLYSTFCFSQINNPEVPNILPASPSATEIAKYSLVGSTLSTGAANMSVPLHSYATNNLQIPINITYSAAGLKVDQVASRVGLGWMLQAGGVISRTVYGNKDESGSFAYPPADFPATTGSALNTYINTVLSGFDTQPDVYNFNFSGYSGRFIIQGSSTIKKLDENNLVISGTPTAGFMVITPDGVKYEFHATESSTNSRHNEAVNNAWYLTRITHPLGDVIYLKYNNCTFNYNLSINQTYTDRYGEDDISGAYCGTDHPVTSLKNAVTNYGVYLSEIGSNSRKAGILRFVYTPREDLPGDYCLIVINLYDGTQDHLGNDTYYTSGSKKSIELGYNTITSSLSGADNGAAASLKRLFLVSLDIDDQAYNFQYKNLNLIPPRLSYSQDDYGFYNGRVNLSLIPDPTFSARLHSMFLTNGFGNRKPDWKSSQIGMLTKAIYPTGGYDSLEYEGNKVYTYGPPNCDVADSTLHIATEGLSTDHNNANYFSAVFHVTCQQTVSVNVGCIPRTLASNGQPAYPLGDYLVKADLINQATGAAINWHDDNPFSSNPLEAHATESKVYNALLSPGDYRLKVYIGGDSRGYAIFDYNNSYATNGNKEIAGIRVKRILSFDKASEHLRIKRFNYDTLANARSTGVLVDKPPLYDYQYKSWCNVAVADPSDPFQLLCVPKAFYFWKLSSANYNDDSSTGSHIFYNRVTESAGDDFENGGIEHTFLIGLPNYSGATLMLGSPIPGSPLSNLGMYSGLEKEQRIFKKVGSQFITLKDVSTTYTEDSRLASSTNYYIFLPDINYGAGACPTNVTTLGSINWLSLSNYSLKSSWLYPSQIQTVSYDINGLNPSTTTQTFTYGNTTHQRVTTMQTTSSKNETLTTNSYYPIDDIPGLSTSSQTAKAELLNRKIITPVLYQRFSRGSITLNTMKSNYLVWSNNLVQPQNVETQFGGSGTASEVRLVFNRYDGNGNTLEVQKTTGPKQAYIWDYTHSFVIAQATNASFTDIAYTSFEADSTGNWSVPSSGRDSTTAITGKRSYVLSNGSITKSGLNSSNTYIVSYWLKSTSPLTISGTLSGYPITGRSYNGWTLYQHKISGVTSLSVSGSSNIDELRFYPVDAQMTTYTYIPLVGISTVNSVSNDITYYEYDDANRLKNVRDQNNNIVKSYAYNLAGISADYGAQLLYYNDVQSRQFTRNNCGSNFGTTVTYTIPAKTYSSLTSQVTADNLAMAALDANGQAYANSNGGCVVCTGEGKKLIKGVCEDGERVNVVSVKHGTTYTCTYYYVFSDGSHTDTYTDTNASACVLGVLN